MPFSPVQRHLKFSHVLGQMSENNSTTTLPTSTLLMPMSRKHRVRGVLIPMITFTDQTPGNTRISLHTAGSSHKRRKLSFIQCWAHCFLKMARQGPFRLKYTSKSKLCDTECVSGQSQTFIQTKGREGKVVGSQGDFTSGRA